MGKGERKGECNENKENLVYVHWGFITNGDYGVQ